MSDETPTVVLVHGAFADASSWNGVVELLQARGLKVTAPANPLRGIAIDAAYIAGVLEQMPGPVLAVGHSYGGAVLSNAATNAAKSSAWSSRCLRPRRGRSAGRGHGRLQGQRARHRAGALALSVRRQRRNGSGVRDRPCQVPRRFRRRPARRAERRDGRHPAARRRGGVRRAVGAAAWKRLPSWAAVASSDTAAGTDVIRSMAERAGAKITDSRART